MSFNDFYDSIELKNICKKALEFWGTEQQLLMVVEECAKLQSTILCYLRDNSNSNNIINNSVQCYIMLNQILEIFNHPHNITQWIKQFRIKMNKLKGDLAIY